MPGVPTVTDAFERMFCLTEELASLHRELAQILMAEKEGRVQSYIASDETSIQGRDRVADFQVAPLSIDALKIKGEIAALNEEKHVLSLLIEFGG